MSAIYFWPHVRNLSVASFRLRCDRVVSELRKGHLPAEFYDGNSIPKKLVISKRYDRNTLRVAARLKEQYGTKIFLDLCDNHFYFEGADSIAIERAADLRTAVAFVDTLIVSSSYLAEIAKREVPNLKRVEVIGDFIEQEPYVDFRHYLRHPMLFAGCLTLSRELDNVSEEKCFRILWFGNHGSQFVDGGMADLLSVRDVLEELGEKFPVSLTVVSNSKNKYQTLIKGWALPTFYRPWNRFTFSTIASLHSISIIPIVFNPFTLAKTSNRVSTSLINGLKVVADSIPSYKEYEGRMLSSEWRSDLVFAFQDKRQFLLSEEEIDLKNDDILKRWKSVLT